jgi:hypothetical protein
VELVNERIESYGTTVFKQQHSESKLSKTIQATLANLDTSSGQVGQAQASLLQGEEIA